MSRTIPVLVAIVGGSGSGKTWLAEKLLAALGGKAARLSLDDFYRDRSPLSPARRAKINFDNPRAIDWPGFERTLRQCLAGKATRVPRYDFKCHTRLAASRVLKPRPIILVEGLWLLRRAPPRPPLRLKIFLDLPAPPPRRRRLAPAHLSPR